MRSTQRLGSALSPKLMIQKRERERARTCAQDRAGSGGEADPPTE